MSRKAARACLHLYHAAIGALELICRCLLAAVFATAAAGKLLDRRGAQTSLVEFGLPARLSQVGAVALPITELIVAVALIPRATAVWGAVGALLLLSSFIGGIARATSQGRAPDCHCFGQLHSSAAGTATLVRNAILAVAAVLVVVGGAGKSLTGALRSLDSTRWALVITATFAGVLAVALVELWSDRRRLQRELQRARAAQARPGLPRGTVAPAFTLAALRGETGSLQDLLRPGRPLLLVFLSTHCGPCLDLLPRLANWQEPLDSTLTIATVFSGDIAGAARLSDEHRLSVALAQNANEVFVDYQLRATPSAVLIGPDGAVASAPAEGTLPIEALIRSSLALTGPASVLVSA